MGLILILTLTGLMLAHLLGPKGFDLIHSTTAAAPTAAARAREARRVLLSQQCRMTVSASDSKTSTACT